MPSCFQLIRKDKPEEGPVVLTKIDEEICAHFEIPCHPIRYACGWYDAIGFRLATGKTFEQIREEFAGYVGEGGEQAGYYEDLLKILAYLEERYESNSFYSPFK